MKTVSEACEATFVYVTPDASETTMKTTMEKVKTDIERWVGVEAEVRNCKWIHAYIGQMAVMLAAGKMSFGECLMAMACQMVAVGMEMERAEMPMIESVPGRREQGYTGL